MDAAIAEILKTGLLGAFVVVMGFIIRSLYNSYQDVQEKRIVEHQAYTEKILTAMNAGTAALIALTDVVKATRERP